MASFCARPVAGEQPLRGAGRESSCRVTLYTPVSGVPHFHQTVSAFSPAERLCLLRRIDRSPSVTQCAMWPPVCIVGLSFAFCSVYQKRVSVWPASSEPPLGLGQIDVEGWRSSQRALKTLQEIHGSPGASLQLLSDLILNVWAYCLTFF